MSTPQPPGTKSEVKRVFVRHESIPEGDLLCPCAPAGVTTVAELKAEAGRRLANVRPEPPTHGCTRPHSAQALAPRAPRRTPRPRPAAPAPQVQRTDPTPSKVLGVSLSVREVLLRGISLDDRRGLSTVLRDGSTVEVRGAPWRARGRLLRCPSEVTLLFCAAPEAAPRAAGERG